MNNPMEVSDLKLCDASKKIEVNIEILFIR